MQARHNILRDRFGPLFEKRQQQQKSSESLYLLNCKSAYDILC